MADASDSKSDAGNSVWVQVPSPALQINNKFTLAEWTYYFRVFIFICCRKIITTNGFVKKVKYRLL